MVSLCVTGLDGSFLPPEKGFLPHAKRIADLNKGIQQ
jgi:hypothetical protein